MMDQERIVPVKEGETYEVSIDSVGEKGDGVAKVKGFVLFVKGVKKGDYVKIKVTKVLRSVGFADVVDHLERPVRESRYATVSQEELKALPSQESEEEYEDTENFGDESDQ